MNFRTLFLFSLIILASCERGALVLYEQKVTPAYLASANVGSPDPRTPPNGQMIVAEWWIPAKVRNLDPTLRIHILFQNFTETTVDFPIHSTVGYHTFSLLNKEFKKKGGFLAYRGEILIAGEKVYAEWRHQLWVKLIDIEEMSPAAVEKSRQASVIETPFCSSES